ncbi:AAA domain-containing protein [Nitrolancea hollandica]|uniref:AAA domain-containing protein n=1 Tax=Nitrolancea hollandica TaxID=1206749 RepID=UPI00135F148F|nr:AAA domain-containing protein [Nitrolancea hollandica]
MRNPVKRRIEEQQWVLWFRSLPTHPAVQTGEIISPAVEVIESTSSSEAPAPTTGDAFIFKVRRPTLSSAPLPPPPIMDWILPGWEEVDGHVEIISERKETNEEGTRTIARFDDEPERRQLMERWLAQRNLWVQTEKPARDAHGLFMRLYELRAQLERETERFELVLGDGILIWRRPEGDVHHPLLLQRLQLEFDPEIPEFTLRETDHTVELYSPLLRSIPDVDGRQMARCREELEQDQYHPMGGDATSGFLRRLVVRLSPMGEFVDRPPSRGDDAHPKITRDPVIFLRARTLGYAVALEAILEDLQGREDLPLSLLNIVGIEASVPDEPVSRISRVDDGSEDEHILLSKPANREQVQIAQRLDHHGAVLVQGPPGTGKSHTIANLVGHLLAQGKRVLITSHTTKALRVLHQQVVEDLQPLCASVLESDSQSQEQLKAAIGQINERLSSSDPHDLRIEAEYLQQKRRRILEELRNTRKRLTNARGDEYRDIVFAGGTFPPSRAARLVAQGQGVDDWIPGPVALGEPLPLSIAEVTLLYRTNLTVTPEDERELSAVLPNASDLLNPDEFQRLVEDYTRLTPGDSGIRVDLWLRPPAEQNPDILASIEQQLTQVAKILQTARSWELAVIAAGQFGGIHREVWDNLLMLVDSTYETSLRAEETLLQYAPALAADLSLDEQIRLLDEIVDHFDGGGKLGRVTLLMHSSWKRLLQQARVLDAPPQDAEHFRALQTLAHLQRERNELTGRWERQMAPHNGPTQADLGEHPERVCFQYGQLLKKALAWYEEEWAPLVTDLERQGFRWSVFLQEIPTDFDQHSELLRLRDAVLTRLPSVLRARIDCIHRDRVDRTLTQLSQRLSSTSGDANSIGVVRQLHAAVSMRDAVAYRRAFERLVEIEGRREDVDLRQQLLHKLEVVAPTWAAAIRDRRPPNEGWNPPGNVMAAWVWRQLHDELVARSNTSLDELQEQINNLSVELQKTTAKLVDRLAWAAQVRRTSLSQRKALVGWLQTVKRIGKGTGKRVPGLRAEARKLMGECRTAVPVWIMPLVRVVENYDPRTTRFDVVIIDEASQSDVLALIALYLAQQVIIVGDDEQVSPDAVGQKIEGVEFLINEHLRGIPNAHLYDGLLSIYDLARQSFGGVICLREHFRSVPEIIQFSNQLSYEGKILPLRDPSHVNLKPHVLAYRVEGVPNSDSVSSKNVNHDEAHAVASLLVAATEQPEYAEKTFGVISLVGEDQAREIDRLLREHLTTVAYEQRRIICGNPAQFQGDERDVIFLSMVDGPNPSGGPLALREAGARDMWKKRFNVAASRARDQMWVVHSLNPDTDLKPSDIRRRLIRHAQDPRAILRSLEQAEHQTDSEFERQVMSRLVAANYRVRPQWKVGHYRIDLVVEGDGKRLAIECDGDRYHPMEKLADDMARQAILERLGWIFVRIRGSAFFRNPDRAMEPVFRRLHDLGIPPVGDESEERSGQQCESELRDRIISRAGDLRAEWEAHSISSTAVRNGHRNSESSPHQDRAGVQASSQSNPRLQQHGAMVSARSVLSSTGVQHLPPALPDKGADGSPIDRINQRTANSRRRVKGSPRRKRTETLHIPDSEAIDPRSGEGKNAGSAPTWDPLIESIARRLPSSLQKCARCHGQNQVWIRSRGPFLECRSCGRQYTVPDNVIVGSLHELKMRCKTCQAPAVSFVPTRRDPFVACALYPRCAYNVPG